MAKEILELVDGKVRVKEKKRSKYRNVRTTVDGVTFDSIAEAQRWEELLLLEKAREICHLTRQMSYPLIVNHVHVATYKCDFRYVLTGRRRGDIAGEVVVEDVKGGKATQTALFKVKQRLMLAINGIDILITGKGT